MTEHLLSDIPEYKQHQQKAKLLFRQMQIGEVADIIRLLPNAVVAHYRPVEDDLSLKLKIKATTSNEIIDIFTLIFSLGTIFCWEEDFNASFSSFLIF